VSTSARAGDPLAGTWRSGRLTKADISKAFVAGGGSPKDVDAFFAQLGGGTKRYVVFTLKFAGDQFSSFERGDGKPFDAGFGFEATRRSTGPGSFALSYEAPSGQCVGVYHFQLTGGLLGFRVTSKTGCGGDAGPNAAIMTSGPFTRGG
jgi:hypothetical protein